MTTAEYLEKEKNKLITRVKASTFLYALQEDMGIRRPDLAESVDNINKILAEVYGMDWDTLNDIMDEAIAEARKEV